MFLLWGEKRFHSLLKTDYSFTTKQYEAKIFRTTKQNPTLTTKPVINLANNKQHSINTQ
jgi:hypothetical protein